MTTPLAPLLLGASLLANNRWHGCATRAGAHPACSSSIWTALASLGFWAVALASIIAGLVVGLAEGRTRRRFAYGRWISVTVVGLCAPWALAAYAASYGLGRLLPARHPRPLRQPRSASSGGWQQAVQLYQTLAAGQQPPAVYAPDLPGAGTVYMDVPFRFARWFGADVTYHPGGMVAVGPPGFVAGAAVGRLIGTSIGYARAASLSRRQWRGHDLARVVVDATATWCQVRGRWLRYDHTAVAGYQVTADQSCVLTFEAIDPLRLYGPSVWCHAVLFAYLRYGRAWQTAPFLHPVQQAAAQMAAVPR